MIGQLKAAAAGWVEDQAAQMGAALAYYTLFSLTPLLAIAIAIIGTLFGEDQTREQVVVQVSEYLGNESADAVRALLENFHGRHAQVGTSIVTLAALWFGATGMFTCLRNSLLRIWRLPPTRESVFKSLVKDYLLATLMVLVSCAFVLVLLLVSTAMPLLEERWNEQFPHLRWAGPVFDFLASTFVLLLLFLFTFRFLAEGRIYYRRLLGGALVSAALFSVGKILIGYYLAYVNLASAYGAAGSLVVFLAWVYYSAQILFYGAEVVRFAIPENRAKPSAPQPLPVAQESPA
jgi:membrane protein